MTARRLFQFLVAISCASAVATVAYCSAPGDVVLSFDAPGSSPTGLAYGDDRLWCADSASDVIYELDPLTGAVLASLPSPAASPMGLAWDDDGYLWCSDSGTARLYRIDPASGAIVSQFGSPGSAPRGMTFLDGALRVSDSYADRIHKVDPSTGAVISAMQSPDSYPWGLAWDGSHLWSGDSGVGLLYRMDPDTGVIDTLVPISCAEGRGLAWDGTHFWHADGAAAVISRVAADGDEQFSLNNPLYFSILFTHVSHSTLGYCTTRLAVPFNGLHQSLTRGISYSPGGLPTASDQWGQGAALYSRWVSGSSTVTWSTGAVTHDLRYILYPELCGTVADIPADVVAEYTVDGDRFDITNPVITSAAAAAVGSETNLYWMYRNIHDYVIDHISYVAAGGWDAAPVVLSRGTGSCSEYSYVFTAICRAAGLPARYQGGSRLRVASLPYVDSSFHRWNEMYIPSYGGWLPVDCTRDDASLPGERLEIFGALPATFFVTMVGGGDSAYLDWDYNSYDAWASGTGTRSRAFYWYANSSASACYAASEGARGEIAASYVLIDPEGDWTHVRVEFSEDGGATWDSATEGAGGDGTQMLSASAGGTAHAFSWDSAADIGATQQSDIRLKITPYMETDGTAAETGSFYVNNLADSDGDNLYDAEEAAYGADAGDPDSDDDGFSDLVEVTEGTDPADAASRPAAAHISFRPDGSARPVGYATDFGAPFDGGRGYGWL